MFFSALFEQCKGYNIYTSIFCGSSLIKKCTYENTFTDSEVFSITIAHWNKKKKLQIHKVCDNQFRLN